MAEGARLESAYTPKGYREFESRFLRQKSVEPTVPTFFLMPNRAGLIPPSLKTTENVETLKNDKLE